MSVLVFADSNNGEICKSAFEAITYGVNLNAGSVTVVTYGNVDDSKLAELGNYGASKAIVNRSVEDMQPEKLTSLVANVAGQVGATIVVLSYDYTGKGIGAAIASKMNAGFVAGAVDYPNMDNGFTVKKAVFSGKAFAHVKVNSDVKIIGLLPNSVDAKTTGGSAEVAEDSSDLGNSNVTVKEFKKKGGEGISLTEAELVVSAGRGLKGPENWGMIEELAQVIGAATACSRPVADIGWRPHHEHVGQTGVAIRPNLYIAIGVSGAIQHLAGVNGSKVIVVINTDAEAPFFKAADYGIVGDAFEVVPKLIEEFKK